MAKNHGNKTGVIILPLAKMHNLADRGKSSAEIAQLIGITKEEMFERLKKLSQKNPKSAKSIRTKIENNDHSCAAPKPTQEKPTPASNAASEGIDYQDKAETTETTETTETEKEILQLQKEISICEEELRVSIQKQEQASRTILDSKAKALENEKALKDLIERLDELKRIYEGERKKIRQAEQTIISCEKEQTEKNLELLRLTTKLQALTKPAVWVYTDGIQTENAKLPENIDTSGWAQLIDSLPEEIGNEIAKKEAVMLLQIKAIINSNPNAEIMFDDGLELVQLAYEAMMS